MDDLKSQLPADQTRKPIGDQGAIPQPTPPEPAPTALPVTEPEKSPEPTPTIPTSTVTTQTITLEEPLSKPSVSVANKPPGKKISSTITIGGALIILLMAATLPATIILVQNKTTIAPKAEEPIRKPRPPHPETGKVFKVLNPAEQESERAASIKPQNLKIENISPESVKISFNTLGAFPSSIIYSPDEDWNYLNMFEIGDLADEWRQRYHPENQKTVYPVGGEEPNINHEFILEGLIPNHKYYFAIQIEKPEEETVYEFGFEQPENHYTFITE